MWGLQSVKPAIDALRQRFWGIVEGVGPQSWKLGVSALRRIRGGDIVDAFGMTIEGGIIFLMLKRDPQSGGEYIVLQAQTFGSFSDLFEIDEFDRFVEAAEDVCSGERNVALPSFSRVLGAMGLVPTGRVLRRRGVSLYGGTFEASVHFMRARTGYEYIVIAMEGRGRHVYYGFELSQFDEFIQSAKSLRRSSLVAYGSASDRGAAVP